ncbi:DgyrCDS10279 [Dimorphilus gyrociliatus]|uniref:DgyrCDS10279 n=1 Tax=Dimorphilus gyrociliatus TaxID=2664684 RepID=A0A7I8W0W2_9ANNE|nr:DgyrCDS10279 [Dimorphilus gyrociliatus]
MSYPPRPPMTVGMVPQTYYQPPPMSMVGVGMVSMPVVTAPPVPAQQNNEKPRLVPQDITSEGEKPPVTTCFVGNICEKAPDTMIRQMLSCCGNVLNWKRVQGASGKLQAFGFCEFEKPESTLRCMRLLNKWQIGDKQLVVKVDTKTKELLDKYTISKPGTGLGKKEDGELKEDIEEALNEMTKKEDRVARAGLTAVMKEYEKDLTKEADDPQNEIKQIRAKDTSLNGIDIEDEKKDIIDSEINKFREKHKDADEVERDKERDYARELRKRREVEAEKRERDKERERDRVRDDRDRDRTKGRDRDKNDYRAKDRKDHKSPDFSDDEEEASYERKRTERKLKQKETAYQERLKTWEKRERMKSREYSKDEEKENERLTIEKKEAKRLRQFLEDYNDERDDGKYYKDNALTKRLREREREMESDARDRNKERHELEEIRKQMEKDGHPDVDREMAKIEQERDQHLLPRLGQPIHSFNLDQPSPDSNMRSSSPPNSPRPEVNDRLPPQSEVKKLGFSAIKLSNNSSDTTTPPQQQPTKKKLVDTVFNQDDDDDEAAAAKRRKLVPIDYGDVPGPNDALNKAPNSAEEKRKLIKKLIDSIPTEKSAAFAYSLNWAMVDASLMDKRIRPWVDKKIVEYIGEEEPTLTDFICQKVMARCTPDSILKDVEMVLDEEAEVFVVKMWRLLIYETEAKRQGLVK